MSSKLKVENALDCPHCSSQPWLVFEHDWSGFRLYCHKCFKQATDVWPSKNVAIYHWNQLTLNNRKEQEPNVNTENTASVNCGSNTDIDDLLFDSRQSTVIAKKRYMSHTGKRFSAELLVPGYSYFAVIRDSNKDFVILQVTKEAWPKQYEHIAEGHNKKVAYNKAYYHARKLVRRFGGKLILPNSTITLKDGDLVHEYRNNYRSDALIKPR